MRTGAQPANPEAAATGTLVGTLALDDPAGTVEDNLLTFGEITPDSAADADGGSSGWFRIFRSDGTTPICDGVYGLAGSGAEMIISVAIVAGAPISISSMALALPVQVA